MFSCLNGYPLKGMGIHVWILRPGLFRRVWVGTCNAVDVGLSKSAQQRVHVSPYFLQLTAEGHIGPAGRRGGGEQRTVSRKKNRLRHSRIWIGLWVGSLQRALIAPKEPFKSFFEITYMKRN